MLNRQKITLVIPCRNEETAIAALLKKVPHFVDEVLVIDNLSSDKTVTIAKKLGAKVVTEKRHVNGIGYGYAHQRGLALATGDIVVTMDGDNTYPVSAIMAAVDHLQTKHLDFVSCNRFPLRDIQAISKVRQFGVWVLNTEVKLLYGYAMKDILSGMWVVRQEIADKLQLKEGGWNLSPEIKLAALHHPAIAFDEFHISHAYRAEGLSKQSIWKTGFDHFTYIVRRRITVDNPVAPLIKNGLSYLPTIQLGRSLS